MGKNKITRVTLLGFALFGVVKTVQSGLDLFKTLHAHVVISCFIHGMLIMSCYFCGSIQILCIFAELVIEHVHQIVCLCLCLCLCLCHVLFTRFFLQCCLALCARVLVPCFLAAHRCKVVRFATFQNQHLTTGWLPIGEAHLGTRFGIQTLQSVVVASTFLRFVWGGCPLKR